MAENGNGKDKAKDTILPEESEKREELRKATVQQGPRANVPLVIQFGQAADMTPTWWSPQRDIYLDKFWRSEDLLSGTIYSMSARNASYAFQVKGPERAVKRAQTMLRGADFGSSWQTFILKVSQDLLCQDNGAFVEVIRPARVTFKWLGEKVTTPAQKSYDDDGNAQWHAVGRGGVLLPMAGLDYAIKDTPSDAPIGIAHLDAQACMRTGDDEYPVVYIDRWGTAHRLRWYQVFTLEDLPSARQNMNGVSYCGVSRVLRAAQILREIRTYQFEKVSGRFNRAVHLVNVDSQVIMDQMRTAEMEADNRGLLRYMHPIIISTLDPQATPAVATLNLAGLPDNFDTEKFLTWYVTSMALGMGVDYGFLAPLPGTGLGTATQSETMARQSRGKSARLFMTMLAAKLNYNGALPKDCEMEFKETDYEEEAAKAGVASTRAGTRAARITSGEITPMIARQIAEDEGDLDHEYLDLLKEQDITDEETLQGSDNPDAAPAVSSGALDALGPKVTAEQQQAAANAQTGGKPGAPGGPQPTAPAQAAAPEQPIAIPPDAAKRAAAMIAKSKKQPAKTG